MQRKFFCQLAMFRRIYFVHTRTQHGQRSAASLQGRLMCNRIHAARQTTHNSHAVLGKHRCEFFSYLAAVWADRTRAHNCNRPGIFGG